MKKQSIAWLDVDQKSRSYEIRDYMRIVAEARYVFRTVQRIIDECAKDHGIEPLEYQALLQIFGTSEQNLPVGHLAGRLNIVSALASRIVQQLECRGLVARTRSEEDRRTTYVSATKRGEALIRSVFDDVHEEVDYFRSKATERQRHAAHEITAFYVGSLGKAASPRAKHSPRDSAVPRSSKQILVAQRRRRS